LAALTALLTIVEAVEEGVDIVGGLYKKDRKRVKKSILF
jgi:hypothetical protein